MSLRGKSFWSIGGGKGGVGKSFLAASLGTALARSGRSVVLVDANLDAPDLHAYVGVKNPEMTLLDGLKQGVKVAEVLIPTPEPGLKFLSCVGDELGMADQNEQDRQKMAAYLADVDAEFVLMDVSGGATRGVLDFFNLAHQGVLITSPEPASMRCTYRFIRNAVYRRVQQEFGAREEVNSALARLRQQAGRTQPTTMTGFLDLLWPTAPDMASNISGMLKDWRLSLLVNMAASEQEHRSADILCSAARKFLNVDLRYCGSIPFDPALRIPGKGKSLVNFGNSDGPVARQVHEAAARLSEIPTAAQERTREVGHEPAAQSQVMGLNDNLDFMGRALHVQTEDLGTAGNCIVTQVFCDGRVVFSTKFEYPSSVRETYRNDRLIELMRKQHRNVIRQVESLQFRHQSGVA